MEWLDVIYRKIGMFWPIYSEGIILRVDKGLLWYTVIVKDTDTSELLVRSIQDLTIVE